MTHRFEYDIAAKFLHWATVLLLTAQYAIGLLMPDIHRGMKPGVAMTWHISIGTVILSLIVARLIWRITHPVKPAPSLAWWQRHAAEAMHWTLYGLVLATTVSGWFFASVRGWSISWFFVAPLPMLTEANSPFGRSIGSWHVSLETALLLLICAHVAVAFAHLVLFRDGVMQRMLPKGWSLRRPISRATSPV
jgi:cytochrome b561